MDWRLWKIWGASLLVVFAGFLIAYQFVEPAPPTELKLATGGEGGAYHAFGERYRGVLAREGVDLILVPSSGAMENLKLLLDDDNEIDVAFMQGGVAGPMAIEGLESLASVFIEPLWIFLPKGKAPKWLRDFHGKRLAIGAKESGTEAVVRQLLGANGITSENSEFLNLTGQDAIKALQTGSIDALFLVASPAAELVQTLFDDPGLELMNIERAGAYKQNFRYLKTVTLAQGAVDLGTNRPPKDITLLAPVASLVAREGLHPTLIDLLMLATNEVHRQGDLFSARGDFPSAKNLDLPLNPDARRYLNNGPPFLQRYLPFSAASFVERMSILLIPLITLLIPLVRILPPVLDWRIRRRVYRWYDELIQIETALLDNDAPVERDVLDRRLNAIEQELIHLSVPRHRSDLVINLRAHVRLIRDRLKA